MQFEFTSHNDISLWNGIFKTLALSKSDPFYEAMGLSIHPSDKLKDISQAYVFGNRTIGHLKHTFERIANEIPNAVEEIYHWGNHSYSRNERLYRQLSKWIGLLAYRYTELTLDENYAISVKNHLEEFIEARDILTKQIEAARKSDQSEWDEPIYEYMRELAELYETTEQLRNDPPDPLAWLSNQCHYRLMLKYWGNISAIIGVENIDDLELWIAQHTVQS